MILSDHNLKLQTWFNSHLLPGPSWAHCRLAACNMVSWWGKGRVYLTPSILSWLPSCWYWLLWGQRGWREVMKGRRFLFWIGMFIRWHFALGTWQMLHAASLSPGHFCGFISCVPTGRLGCNSHEPGRALCSEYCWFIIPPHQAYGFLGVWSLQSQTHHVKFKCLFQVVL